MGWDGVQWNGMKWARHWHHAAGPAVLQPHAWPRAFTRQGEGFTMPAIFPQQPLRLVLKSGNVYPPMRIRTRDL